MVYDVVNANYKAESWLIFILALSINSKLVCGKERDLISP
jgi:hypothetical protein